MKRFITITSIVAVLALSLVVVGCSSGTSSSGAAASTSGAASSASADSSASSGAAVDVKNLSDGEYTVGVTLGAGSGQGAIETPARFIVANGEKHAYIVWSSDGYESMTVAGTEYYPVPRAGNTTFEVVFDAFDKEIPISVTKSDSEEPAYEGTIVFDSSTVTK